MTNYAKIDDRSAWLFNAYGERIARSIFTDEVIDALPKYKRGRNAGKPKGLLRFEYVDRGGWVRREGDRGYVETRVGKIILAKLVMPQWGAADDEVLREWDYYEGVING